MKNSPENTKPFLPNSPLEFYRAGQLFSTPKKRGLLPLSRSSGWRLSREGKMPKPFKLSPGVAVWSKADIDAWIEGQKAA